MKWQYLPDLPEKSGFYLVWYEWFSRKSHCVTYFETETNKFYTLSLNKDLTYEREELDCVVKWCGFCGIADALNFIEYKEKGKAR